MKNEQLIHSFEKGKQQEVEIRIGDGYFPNEKLLILRIKKVQEDQESRKFDLTLNSRYLPELLKGIRKASEILYGEQNR